MPKSGGEENKVETPAIDVDKLKNEMVAMNKENNEQLIDTVMKSVSALGDKITEGYKSVHTEKERKEIIDGSLEEFKEEIEDLDLDESQSKALLSMMNKAVKKNSSNLKDEIKKEVKGDSDFTTQKSNYEAEVAGMYPDILNDKSKLWKQAKVEYNKLSDYAKKGPDATKLATIAAAQVLGIKPITERDIRSHDAHTEVDRKKFGRDPDSVTEKQITFAQGFGVKADAFKAKLKQVLNKSM